MAIVEMKRVTLLAMTADKDKLLRALQRAGCVEVSEVQDEAARAYAWRARADLDSADEKLSRIRWTLSQLGRFEPKAGMLAAMSLPEASADEAKRAAQDEPALMAVVEKAEALERKSGDLRGAEARIRARIDQLLPWRSLDIPVEKISRTRDTVQFVGSVEGRALEELADALAGLPARLSRVGDERDGTSVWVIAHRSAEEKVHRALKEAGFAAAQFPGDTGTPAEQLDALRVQLDALLAERDLLGEALREMAAQAPRLRLLYEIVSERKERESAASRFLSTKSAFLMQGWAPAHACEKLQKRLRAASPSCEVEIRDALSDEQPPTLFHNHRFVAPFESVVANYSMPDPRGLDPTFIMAPFFACFFGMMVSDAGYGLIMAILIPLVIHLVKPKTGLKKMMWILTIGGMMTVFWGAMFDTWFGMSVMPMLINTLEQPLEMMGLCLGLGVLHLFAGLGVAAYMNIKRKKPLDALFDQFFWFALVCGLPMLALPATAGVGKVLAVVGALGILLTAGRTKPTLLKKLTGGLGALYGVTSWLSDILSYMRLFGMGLATGVIGMVINMLAGMILSKGIFGIVAGVAVLIVGHVFNAAVNILGAYVHACRLQYIEFFGKFYEEGGVPFRPLATNPRYIAIRPSGADGVEE